MQILLFATKTSIVELQIIMHNFALITLTSVKVSNLHKLRWGPKKQFLEMKRLMDETGPSDDQLTYTMERVRNLDDEEGNEGKLKVN